MATLKLYYEGWLALPSGLRQKLGLKSGDRLEAELAGDTIVLRRPQATEPQPALGDQGKEQPAPTVAPRVGPAKPVPATTIPSTTKVPPAARRTTRQPAPTTVPPVLKSRGRRKMKDTAEGRPTSQSSRCATLA